ncbi:hypothetical protein BDY21DRAFT_354505 [Lineolata rhizophorae]|uniref:Cytidyltransferase-like domain-containing protein n=1 Tax=Lineolata rhizophorae TaxID=578093 RepID=A0A6A6NQA5_9PEZI|nr:hypothetical protein BDY21DRAFT_354505 [Lineolata rhizophorae]
MEGLRVADEGDEARRHYSVAVGGTFDHLHVGHKLLLTMFAFMVEPGEMESFAAAASASSEDEADEDEDEDEDEDDEGEDEAPMPLDRKRLLTVGITGDSLLRNKAYSLFLSPWSARQRAVSAFLRAILDFSPAGADPKAKVVRSKESPSSPEPNCARQVLLSFPLNLKVRCVEILDAFGPTTVDPFISALVLSAETRKGGQAVNEKRAERGWDELEVLEVDVLDAGEGEDGDDEEGAEGEWRNKLSSTALRKKEAERAGVA